MRFKETLKRNRWRYLSLAMGFFLFVAPFALFSRVIFLAIGNTASPTLHTLCFRMPIDWFFGGRFSQLIGSIAAMFIVGVILIALVVGPVFCGWLCPVGAVSEGISRAVPIPEKYRVKIKDTKTTTSLRYGFLVGFIAVAATVGYKLSPQVASICCRLCSASVLQNMTSAVFGDFAAIEYWHSGSLLVLGSWLLVGGVMFSGGRGWCTFFCPLGGFSNLSHKVGAKLGLYKTEFDAEKCRSCSRCQVSCPMWAIKEDKSVESGLCINCQECSNSCAGGAYSYQRGKRNG